jgi:hypothetical protein
MLTEPGGERRSGAIGEQIDHAALLQVHQEGGVVTPPPQGEIINPQHPWRSSGRKSRLTNDADTGRGADGHPQLGADPCAGFAAQRKSEHGESAREALGPLRPKRQQRWQGFGERALRAGRIITKKAPDV